MRGRNAVTSKRVQSIEIYIEIYCLILTGSHPLFKLSIFCKHLYLHFQSLRNEFYAIFVGHQPNNTFGCCILGVAELGPVSAQIEVAPLLFARITTWPIILPTTATAVPQQLPCPPWPQCRLKLSPQSQPQPSQQTLTRSARSQAGPAPISRQAVFLSADWAPGLQIQSRAVLHLCMFRILSSFVKPSLSGVAIAIRHRPQSSNAISSP